ncbi:MAG: DUF1282 family protein [Bacteroidaceae bacterium]|nr:DUF1282 family protein [Bacteroidaceae bacterium]
MNYKELFRRLFQLIASPKKAWVEISTESPRRDVTASFVYPLIALCGLAVLLSNFLSDGLKRNVYQPALMEMCSYCIALFGGFFLAAWLLDTVRQKVFGHTPDMPGSQFFVGYTMGVVFLADMLTILFPQFFIFKWILQFYVLYVVWEGSDVLFSIEDDKRLMFTALTSVAIVFSPAVIRALFNMLSSTLG